MQDTGCTTEATYVIDRDGRPEYPEHYVKIGYTRIRIPPRSEGFNGSYNHVSKLFQHRLDDLQTGSPHKLRLICAFAAYRSAERCRFPAGHLERWLHERFAAQRVQGEWFNFPAPAAWSLRCGAYSANTSLPRGWS
jgi:hypothetical protein